MVSSFESPRQEHKEEDNPISLKDLHTASITANKNQLRDQIKVGKSFERSQSGSNNIKDNNKNEIPESIRKVKEEIKKKIERYAVNNIAKL